VYLQGLLAALLYASAALLVVAGMVKLRRPQPTTDALTGVGLPGRRALARVLGATELVVGLAAFVWPSAAAPAMAMLFAGFAGFVGYVLARGLPLSSCGCLGETDTEPSRVHVAVTGAAAAAALAAAIVGLPSAPDLLADTPVAGTFFLATVLTACYLTYLILVSLPEAFAAYQQPTRSDD
jgi:hypothetical protein